MICLFVKYGPMKADVWPLARFCCQGKFFCQIIFSYTLRQIIPVCRSSYSFVREMMTLNDGSSKKMAAQFTNTNERLKMFTDIIENNHHHSNRDANGPFASLSGASSSISSVYAGEQHAEKSKIRAVNAIKGKKSSMLQSSSKSPNFVPSSTVRNRRRHSLEYPHDGKNDQTDTNTVPKTSSKLSLSPSPMKQSNKIYTDNATSSSRVCIPSNTATANKTISASSLGSATFSSTSMPLSGTPVKFACSKYLTVSPEAKALPVPIFLKSSSAGDVDHRDHDDGNNHDGSGINLLEELFRKKLSRWRQWAVCPWLCKFVYIVCLYYLSVDLYKSSWCPCRP